VGSFAIEAWYLVRAEYMNEVMEVEKEHLKMLSVEISWKFCKSFIALGSLNDQLMLLGFDC